MNSNVTGASVEDDEVKQGKQCFQRWNRCVRSKVVKFDSLGLETC